MKKQYTLEIAGRPLHVVSENDEKYVNDLVSDLNRRITGYLLSASGTVKEDAVLICALNLLDENKKLRALLSESRKTAGGTISFDKSK